MSEGIKHPSHPGRDCLLFTVAQERGCGQTPRGPPCLISQKLEREERRHRGAVWGDQCRHNTISGRGPAPGPAQREEAVLQGEKRRPLGLRATPRLSLDVVEKAAFSALPSSLLPPQVTRSRLTCKEFITPLASTAIFPATDLTPCLNWAMSAVGSTFPRVTLPVREGRG